MLAAGDISTYLPLSLYATIPLWPFLGMVIVGVLIAARRPATKAAGPVIATVGFSAVLSILLFFDLSANLVGQGHGAPGDGHDGGHANAAAIHVLPVSVQDHDANNVEPTLIPPDHAESISAPDHGEAGAASMSAPDHEMIEAAPHHAAAHGDSAVHYTGHGFVYTLYNWLSLGAEESLENGQWIAVNFMFDGLTAVMLIVVTVISTLIVIYSRGYIADHHLNPAQGHMRFFAFLGLFVFSMCMLVLGGNFVVLYLGWELVGLSSYLLIGFYFYKPSAAAAAKKAFLVNRIGDFGFALGIFALYMFINPLTSPGENPLDYDVVFKYAASLTESQANLVCLLLLCGAIGKSAQLPLYVWLPDAMEGPSPVSALIHAATMVTAGVYMVARCGPLYAMSETAQIVIIIMGAAGAFFAATMAMAQYDIKRVLAYSTMSQLAYMFVALGVGASSSAIFHLYTHAFFKALLFLSAGSVMHAMGNIIDVRQFSGLRRVLPHTYLVFLVGALALSGFPLLAGFWSKDEIVHASWDYSPWLGGVMLLTAFMTAYYTFRIFFLCFFGPERWPTEAGDHPHESPGVMLNPMRLLAVGAVFAGFLGVTLSFGTDSFLMFLKPHGYIHTMLHTSTIQEWWQPSSSPWLMYLSAALAIGGIGLAYVRYGTAPQEDPDKAALGPLWLLWHAKYYVDELYNAVFVQPLRMLGNVFFGVDRYGIDGLIWLVAAVPRGAGAALRGFQRGALQSYALGMLIGMAVLLAVWNLFGKYAYAAP